MMFICFCQPNCLVISNVVFLFSSILKWAIGLKYFSELKDGGDSNRESLSLKWSVYHTYVPKNTTQTGVFYFKLTSTIYLNLTVPYFSLLHISVFVYLTFNLYVFLSMSFPLSQGPYLSVFICLWFSLSVANLISEFQRTVITLLRNNVLRLVKTSHVTCEVWSESSLFQ